MTDHAFDAFDLDFRRAVRAIDLKVSAEQVRCLWTHYRCMVEANRSLNLTRITDASEAAVRHYADSLAPIAWLRQRGTKVQSILDIGTGAGFPTVPLAACRPAFQITAIDGTRKKIDFLRQALDTCGLSNVAVHHARAEEWKTDARFDLVISRAVGTLEKLLRWSGRFVAPAGFVVAMKTAGLDATEEQKGALLAAGFGLAKVQPFAYTLDAGDQQMRFSLYIWQKR